MSGLFQRVFIDHPQTVGESYFAHMRFAGWFGAQLILAGLAALVHAILPCVFERTAGRMIAEMHAVLQARH